MTVKYRVVECLRHRYPVTALCRILNVSRGGCYAWRHRFGQEDSDAWPKGQIRICQTKTNFTYGYWRVCLWIKKTTGVTGNRKRVLRFMRQGGLAQVRRRRAYTHCKAAVRRCENILNRQFEQRYKNLFRGADITYIDIIRNVLSMCDYRLNPFLMDTSHIQW